MTKLEPGLSVIAIFAVLHVLLTVPELHLYITLYRVNMKLYIAITAVYSSIYNSYAQL